MQTFTNQFYQFSKVGIIVTMMLTSSLGKAQLSGTYTVGTNPGDDFSSLTNVAGMFDAINTFGLSGNVIIEITTDLPAETGTNSLDQWVGLSSVTIVPQSASLKTITHSGCGDPLILLNGADMVTIDGRFAGSGTNRFLRFESACPDQSPIRLEDDSQDVTIRNCIIASDNNQTSQSTGGAIHVHDNQTGGSDNLKILNNLIEDFSAPIDLFDAVQVNAPDVSGAVMEGLEIKNNEFKNANGKGIYLIDRNGEINNSIIYGNSIYADGTITGPGTGWAFAPIQMESGSGHTIRANWIGGTIANCNGSKMNINLSPGTQLVTIIRMKSDLPNSSINNIDSNIVKNINFVGSTANYLGTTVIRIESGNCDIGVNDGNIIGDINLDASNPASCSIQMTESFNSTSNYFRAIYATTAGTINIENNSIGGILLSDNNSNGISSYLIYSSGSSANIRNNIIGGSANNIVKTCDGPMRGIFSNGDNLSFEITDNTISGFNVKSSFEDDVYAIRVSSGNGTPTISGNTIQTMSIGDAINQIRFYGIYNLNDNANISSNNISNVTVNSSDDNQFYGIYVSGSGSTFTINGNSINGGILANSNSYTKEAIGIYTSGTSIFNISKNFISNLEIESTSNSSYIRGINTNSSAGNTLTNNVILLSNGSNSNDIYIYGIYSNESSGSCNIWFNTVDIRGTASGSRRSACIYKTNGANRDVQSNIFNNKRTGGSGGHYAIYNTSTSGALVYNYNLLHVDEDPSKLVNYSGSKDFAQWQGLGFATNSLSPVTTVDLINSSTGQQTTTLGNDVANPGLGVNDDHIGTGRPLGAGHDMGAFEDDNPLLPPYDLPITLGAFNAQCLDDKYFLNWNTKSEINNAYFIIESSIDGKDWVQETTVVGAGNSSITLKYDLILENLSPSTVYFRLTQVDFNGDQETFSPVKVDCATDDCSDFYTNINGSSIELTFSPGCITGESVVQIFDSLGKIVLLESSSEANMQYNLGQGIYHIKIYNSGREYYKKIVLF